MNTVGVWVCVCSCNMGREGWRLLLLLLHSRTAMAVDLARNNTVFLAWQAESFFPLQNLHGLKLSGNPWNCSCSLKPLRMWMLKNNVPFEGIPPICQEPTRLRDKPWDRLQLEDFACLPKLETLAPEERIRRTIEGHNTTFVCRLEATSDTHVSFFCILCIYSHRHHHRRHHQHQHKRNGGKT